VGARGAGGEGGGGGGGGVGVCVWGWCFFWGGGGGGGKGRAYSQFFKSSSRNMAFPSPRSKKTSKPTCRELRFHRWVCLDRLVRRKADQGVDAGWMFIGVRGREGVRKKEERVVCRARPFFCARTKKNKPPCFALEQKQSPHSPTRQRALNADGAHGLLRQISPGRQLVGQGRASARHRRDEDDESEREGGDAPAGSVCSHLSDRVRLCACLSCCFTSGRCLWEGNLTVVV